MKKAKKLEGVSFYQNSGFEKKILVHVPPAIHTGLKELAKKRGKSLQLVVRAMLEKGLQRATASQ